MEARSVLRGLQPPTGADPPGGLLPGDDLLGDTEVCIAVLDGPVDLDHPCFAGADLTRLDTLVGEPAGPGPMSLHGTHVASLLFGQPGSAVVGIVPRCRGLILPVFTDEGAGRVPQLDLARAVERAVQEGAHIVNISGGERSQDAQADGMLERALRLCDESGVLVVAAVGNDGCDCQQVPAAVASVLAVGAAAADGSPLEINNWSSAYAATGVLAPGQDIEGAAPGGGRIALTGSSFATPLVSGVAALLVGAQLRTGHGADPQGAGRAVLRGADAVPCQPVDAPDCRRRLAGRLDAARAYRLVSRGDVTGPQESVTAGTEAAALVVRPSPGSGARAAGAVPAGAFLSGSSDLYESGSSDLHEEVTTMDTESASVVTAQQQASDPAAAPVPAGAGGPVGDPAGSVLPTPPVPEPAGLAPAGATAVGATPPAPPAPGACRCQGGGPQEAGPGTGGALASAPAAQSAAQPLPPPVRTFAPPRTEPARPAAAVGGGVRPSCASTNDRPLVYAIGQVGVDFLTEARRDSFRQLMSPVGGAPTADGRPTEAPANPYDARQLYGYLVQNPWASDKVTWTLTADGTPLYALEAEPAAGMDWSAPILDPSFDTARLQQLAGRPDELAQVLLRIASPPVSTVYRTLRDALLGQAQGTSDPTYVSRVSIPGRLTDRTVRLFSGQVVPVVEVKGRGLYTWTEALLTQEVLKAVEDDTKARKITVDETEIRTTVRAFLDKIYYQFRNLGQSSADRALNYAGTNAFLFGSQISAGMLAAKHVPGPGDRLYTLESISVAKSPYCRMGSDCQDVTVRFFDPENDRRARVTWLFTIDVSDEMPVSLAPTHQFLD
ncbi:S8 family serine peptidase [Kitasatospora sp. NPDC096140]|uniref:cyanobactin maturation protease PatG family protein n=1 Tax=Kitasatospora sp. NPDC096140 TaxID=3155425 RepID=UPI00331670AC